MSSKKFFILSLFFFLIFLFLGWNFPSFSLIDEGVYRFFSSLAAYPEWLKINQGLTLLGTAPCLLTIVFILSCILFYKGQKAMAFWSFLSLALSLQASSTFKVFFERPRPSFFIPDIFNTYSYPSGHALGALVFSVILLQILKQFSKSNLFLKIGFILFTLLIGMTRLALGVHWMTDIFGGYLLGAGCLGVAYAIKQNRLLA